MINLYMYMKYPFLMEDLLSSEWPFSGVSLVISIIGGLILVALLFKRSYSTVKDPSLCDSPNCVRCRQSKESDQVITNTLKERCLQYITKYRCAAANPNQVLAEEYPRILDAISSLADKPNILASVYEFSGYKLSNETQHPHIWTVPDLTRRPFWNPHTIVQIKSIFTTAVFNRVLEDYKTVNSTEQGWKLNNTPTGKWRIYPIFNQGNKVVDNCVNCSDTVRIVESIQTFMHGCVYGNTMFSVLHSNSVIEPHTGPCNFRLRCHLPLIAPSGFKVRVATETREWTRGELLVFDDSCVHSVWYEGAGSGVEPRVVLIFDIWHPELRTNEIDMLRHCYSDSF